MEEEEEEGGRGGDAGRLCLPAAPTAPVERTEGPAPASQVGDRDGDRVTPRGAAGPPPGRRHPAPLPGREPRPQGTTPPGRGRATLR